VLSQKIIGSECWKEKRWFEVVEFKAFGKKPKNYEAWSIPTTNYGLSDYYAYKAEHFRLALLEAAEVEDYWASCQDDRIFRKKYKIGVGDCSRWVAEQLRKSAGE
jgi:hypothetical protein